MVVCVKKRVALGALLFGILLILGLFFPSFSGMIIYRSPVNLSTNTTISIPFLLNQSPTSIKASGTIIGESQNYTIMLSDGNRTYLLLNSTTILQEGILLSGFDSPKTIGFDDVCEETCRLNGTSQNLTLTITVADATINLSSVLIAFLDQNTTELNISSVFTDQNITTNQTSAVKSVEVKQAKARLGEPVKFVKRVKLEKRATNFSTSIPSEALNVTVVKRSFGVEEEVGKIKIEDEGIIKDVDDFVLDRKKEEIQKKIDKTDNRSERIDLQLDLLKLSTQPTITGAVVFGGEIPEDNSTTVIIEETIESYEEVEIMYELPPPEAVEEVVSDHEKKITISSDQPYIDVVAFMNLPTEASASSLRLYWYENGSRERKLHPIDVMNDTNGNGLIDYIEWTVPHLSNQTFEIEIVILNVQSYPVVGGIWEVRFNTTGTANLTIEGYGGTTFGTGLPDDLGFKELYCGETLVPVTVIGNGVFVENYSCDSLGYHRVTVFTTGIHNQRFTFGNLTAEAHNLADTAEDNNWRQWGHYGNGTRYTNSSGPLASTLLWTVNASVAGSSHNFAFDYPVISDDRVIITRGTDNGATGIISTYNLSIGLGIWNSTTTDAYSPGVAVSQGKVYYLNKTPLTVAFSLSIINLSSGQVISTSDGSLASVAPLIIHKETLANLLETTIGSTIDIRNITSLSTIWFYNSNNLDSIDKIYPTLTSSYVVWGYSTGSDLNLTAYNLTTGDAVWANIIPELTVSDQQGSTDEVDYFLINNKTLLSYDLGTGASNWQYFLGNGTNASIALFGDRLLFGTSGKRFYAINKTDGTQLWNYSLGGEVHSTGAVSGNGIVYFGSRDNNIYALNATSGLQLWNYTTGGDVDSAAAIAQGVMLIASSDGLIYAFQDSPSLPPDTTTWELYGHYANGTFGTPASGPKTNSILWQSQIDNTSTSLGPPLIYNNSLFVIGDKVNKIDISSRTIVDNASYTIQGKASLLNNTLYFVWDPGGNINFTALNGDDLSLKWSTGEATEGTRGIFTHNNDVLYEFSSPVNFIQYRTLNPSTGAGINSDGQSFDVYETITLGGPVIDSTGNAYYLLSNYTAGAIDDAYLTSRGGDMSYRYNIPFSGVNFNRNMYSHLLLADDTVFFVLNTTLQARDASTGASSWSYTFNKETNRSAVAYAAPYLLAANEKTLYIFNITDHAQLYNVTLDGVIAASPVVSDTDKVAYVSSWYNSAGKGTVYGINITDGTTLWTRTLDGPIAESGALTNGTLYITTNQSVYAFDDNAETLAVTLSFPPSMSGDNDGNITFSYTVSDSVSISNCSLYVKSVLNQTNTSITRGVAQYFSIVNSEPSVLNWSVNCTNTDGNNVSSDIWTHIIDITAGYSGNTTNFTAVANLTETQLVLDKPGVGKITYSPLVNLSRGINITDAVIVSSNYVSIDSASYAELDLAANISLEGLSYTYTPTLLKDALSCQEPDCHVLTYGSGSLLFNVTGFSNYTTVGNSQLTIFDDSDNEEVVTGQNFKFYANYSNSSDSTPAFGPETYCGIVFNAVGPFVNMSYNSTSHYYEYNKTFLTAGTFVFNVTCNGTTQGFEHVNLTDGYVVAEYVNDSAIWAMAQNYPNGTGTTSSLGPKTARVLWNVTLPGTFSTNAPIISNGILVVPGSNLTAYNLTTGSQLWVHFNNSFDVMPSLAVTGQRVFVGNRTIAELNYGLSTINITNGELLATSLALPGQYADSVMVTDGTYVGINSWLTGNVHITLYNITTLNQEHNVADNSAEESSKIGPVLIGDSVYAIHTFYETASETFTMNFTRYNTSTGVTYRTSPGNNIDNSPDIKLSYRQMAYDGSGLLYSANHTLYKVDMDGSVIWSYDTANASEGSPAYYNHTILFPNNNKTLLALNTNTGVPLWNYTTNGSVRSSVIVSGEGIAYFGTDSNLVFAVNATNGLQLWNYTMPGKVRSHLALADNTLIALTTNGGVYAFKDVEPSSITLTESDNNTWPVFQHFNNGTGFTNGSGPVNPSVLWNYGGIGKVGSPVISDGRAFVVTFNQSLFAFNTTTGNQLWNFSINESAMHDGHTLGVHDQRAFIYQRSTIGSSNGVNITAVNTTTGALLWATLINSSNVLKDEYGIISFSSDRLFTAFTEGSNLWVDALNLTNGYKIWEFNKTVAFAGTYIISGPVQDGTDVYVITQNDKTGFGGNANITIHKFSQTDGSYTEVVTCCDAAFQPNPPNGVVHEQKAPLVNGRIVFSFQENTASVINITMFNVDTGTMVWDRGIGGASKRLSSFAYYNNTLYFGNDNKTLYALNFNTGEELWHYGTNGSIRSSPIVSGNGIVYFGDANSTVFAVNATSGSQVWNQSVDSAVTSSPALVDGTIFLGTLLGTFYALRDSTLLSVNEDNNWLQWMHYGNRTGKTNGTGPVNPSLLWNVSIDNPAGTNSSLIDGERVFMVASNKLFVYNLTTGQSLWNFTLQGSGSLTNSYLIQGERIILGNFTSSSLELFALNTTNNVSLWTSASFTLDDPSLLLATDESQVYYLRIVSTALGSLFAIDITDGSTAWSRQLSLGTPSILATKGLLIDGSTLVFNYFNDDVVGVDEENYLHGYSTADGSTVFNVTLKNSSSDGYDTGFGLSSDGDSYFIVLNHSVKKVNNTAVYGGGGWEFNITQSIRTGIALSDDRLFFSTLQNYTYAVNKTSGQQLWTQRCNASITSSPIVSGNGVVYTGCNNNFIYALNETTGVHLWNYSVGGAVKSTAALVDGILVFGSDDGRLYALQESTNQPPTINLSYPPSGDSFYADSLPFLVNATDDAGLLNMTLYTDASGMWQAVATSTFSGVNDGHEFKIYSIEPGVHVWNAYVCDSDGACTFSAINSTYTITYNKSKEWPMYGNYQNGTRNTPSPGPKTRSLLWKTNATSGSGTFSFGLNYPVISEGRVIISRGDGGDNGGKISAYNLTTGSLLWNSSISDSTLVGATVKNGVIYYTNKTAGGSLLFSISSMNLSNGSHIRSSANLGTAVDHLLVQDEVIYSVYDSSLGATIRSLNETSFTSLWNYAAGFGWMFALGDPALSGNNIFYLSRSSPDGGTTFNTNLTSYNKKTGVSNWRTIIAESDKTNRFQQLAADDSNLYFFVNTTLYSYDQSTGSQNWNYTLNSGSNTSVAVFNKTLYFGLANNLFYAINKNTGLQLWNYTIGGPIHSTAAISNEGIIYFGGGDNKVYGLNATSGTQLWNYTTDGPVSSAAALADGTLIFGSNDGFLYAFGDSDSIPPNITLNQPYNNTLTTTITTLQFNYTPADNNTITSCALFTNHSGVWQINQSNTSIDNGTINTFTIPLLNTTVSFVWNVQCSDILGNGNYSQGNFTFVVNTSIDTLPPTSSSYALNNSHPTIAQDAQFNATLADDIGGNSWIFTWNKSGYYENITNGSWSGVSEVISLNLSMSGSAGRNLTYFWWFDDAAGNYNTSALFTLDLFDNIPGFSGFAINNTSPNKTDTVQVNATLSDDFGGSLWFLTSNLTGSWQNLTNGSWSGASETVSVNVSLTSAGGRGISYRWSARDVYGNSNVSEIQGVTMLNTAPNVSLHSPTINQTLTFSSVIFLCNVSDDFGLANATLLGNFTGVWAEAESASLSGTGGQASFSVTLANGFYEWSCAVTDNDGAKTNATENRTFTVTISSGESEPTTGGGGGGGDAPPSEPQPEPIIVPVLPPPAPGPIIINPEPAPGPAPESPGVEGKKLSRVELAMNLLVPKAEQKSAISPIACFIVDGQDSTALVESTQKINIPKGKEIIYQPFSLSCGDNRINITFSIPDTYTDLEVIRCEGRDCQALPYYPVEELACGVNPPSSAVRLIENVTIGNNSYLQPPNEQFEIILAHTITKEETTAPSIIFNYRLSKHIDENSLAFFTVKQGEWERLGGTIHKKNNTAALTFDSPPGINDQIILLGQFKTSDLTTTFENVFTPVPESRDMVLLVHGLGSDPTTYDTLINDIASTNQPYQVWTFGYQSNTSAIDLGWQLAEYLQMHEGEYDNLYIVAHSLGGIITQQALWNSYVEDQMTGNYPYVKKVRKVIMAGTPNDGLPGGDVYEKFYKAMVNAKAKTPLLEFDSPLLDQVVHGLNTPRVPFIDYNVIAGIKPYTFTIGSFKTTSGALIGDDEPNDGLVTMSSAQHVGDEFISERCTNFWDVYSDHRKLIKDPVPIKVIERAIAGELAKESQDVPVLGSQYYIEVPIDGCFSQPTFVIIGRKIASDEAFDPTGCACGNGVCGLGEDEATCPADCEKKGLSVFDLTLIVLIILILLGIYFLARKRKHRFSSMLIWKDLLAANAALSMNRINRATRQFFFAQEHYHQCPLLTQKIVLPAFLYTHRRLMVSISMQYPSTAKRFFAAQHQAYREETYKRHYSELLKDCITANTLLAKGKIPQAKGMYTALLGSHSHLKKEDRDELTIRLHALYENFQIMLLRGGGKQ